MSHKIVVHGMMTSENFGDVLLAQIVTRWLRELTSMELVLANASPEIAQILGCRRARLIDYFSAKGVILSGGGYFQMMDHGLPAMRRFVKNVGPLLAGRLMQKPIGMVGVGVDELPHAVMRSTLRYLLNVSSIVGLRDPRSVEHARNLKLKRLPILTSDLVFSVTEGDTGLHQRGRASELLSKLNGKRLLGIHLSDSADASPRYRQLHHLLKVYLPSVEDEAGFVLLEDHPGGNGGQRRAQREIMQYLSERNTVIIPYETTELMLAVLSKVDAVLTNKLHVGLAAAAVGTAPFSVAKNRKNLSSFKALGLSDNCCMLDESDSILERIVSTFVVHEGTVSILPKIRELAAKNKELLSEFVGLISRG